MEENFISASKQKLRFKVANGNVSVEDLWDLPIEVVDALAIGYSKQLDDTNTTSYIKPKRTNKVLELKLEIAIYVIKTRVAEDEDRRARAEKATKRAQILELIQKKELGSLEAKSLEELQKEYEALV